MNSLLVICFIATLIYLSISVNIKSYINIIAFQGLLLFGVAILELREIDVLHFSFILAETLIFKAIVIPYLMYRVSVKNKIINLKNATTHRITKGFNMVIITITVIAFTFLFSFDLHEDHLDVKYFSAALSSIILGLIFIIINRNITLHLISYLVIENGIFLLALAVGAEMPMMINWAILLDIFASVMVLGIFFNKLGEVHGGALESDRLNELKD